MTTRYYRVDPETGHTLQIKQAPSPRQQEQAALKRLRGRGKKKPPDYGCGAGTPKWLRNPYPWEE